jgi:hypothetical protein
MEYLRADDGVLKVDLTLETPPVVGLSSSSKQIDVFFDGSEGGCGGKLQLSSWHNGGLCCRLIFTLSRAVDVSVEFVLFMFVSLCDEDRLGNGGVPCDFAGVAAISNRGLFAPFSSRSECGGLFSCAETALFCRLHSSNSCLLSFSDSPFPGEVYEPNDILRLDKFCELVLSRRMELLLLKYSFVMLRYLQQIREVFDRQIGDTV